MPEIDQCCVSTATMCQYVAESRVWIAQSGQLIQPGRKYAYGKLVFWSPRDGQTRRMERHVVVFSAGAEALAVEAYLTYWECERVHAQRRQWVEQKLAEHRRLPRNCAARKALRRQDPKEYYSAMAVEQFPLTRQSETEVRLSVARFLRLGGCFCRTSWNLGCHRGRWPDNFGPPCPALRNAPLGGMPTMAKCPLIDPARETPGENVYAVPQEGAGEAAWYAYNKATRGEEHAIGFMIWQRVYGPAFLARAITSRRTYATDATPASKAPAA